MTSVVSEIFGSPAFANAFWVFIGIVAGTIIQFNLHQRIQKQQRKNASRIFLSEVEINKQSLTILRQQIERKKEKFSSGQVDQFDFDFDMKDFNYQIVDPLINSGFFHHILGGDGVKMYFRFMNDLNVDSAQTFSHMLKTHHDQGRSINFLNWILDDKMQEWFSALAHAESQCQKV